MRRQYTRGPGVPLYPTGTSILCSWYGFMLTFTYRAAAYMGCPSPSLLFNQTIDSLLDGSSSISMPRYFILHLETARFANKLISTMSASLEQSQGVSHRLVAQMEEEYSKVQCLMYPDNSGEHILFSYIPFAGSQGTFPNTTDRPRQLYPPLHPPRDPDLLLHAPPRLQ